MENTMLNRLQDESAFAYHKRLVTQKVVDKTLNDIDYSELSEYVYGKAYNSDVSRRMMYGSAKTLQLIEDCAGKELSGNELLSEIERKRIELQKEAQKLYDQRRERKKFITEISRAEHLEDALIEAANRLNTTKELSKYTRPESSCGAPEAILVFSDWHYGMTAENVWNTFDKEICKKRIETVVGKAADRLVLHDCGALHIVVLGDLIHGAIHTSARVASDELVCNQLMQATELLAEAINELSQYVPHTYIYTTYGNHARTVQSKNDSIHKDNMERVIPWWLEQRFQGRGDIHVVKQNDDELIELNILGHCGYAAHGDIDSVKSSPKILNVLWNRSHDSKLEFALFADKHHYEAFEELGVASMVADALCGADEYANNRRLYATPGQLMLVVDRENGIDATYHLKAEKS